MTLETQLRSAMADAVATARPDTDHLVAVARRRGLGIRRRRQALSVVGVAAALALAVGAPTWVAGDRGPRATGTDSVAVGSTTQSFDGSVTAPITGRSTAAALLYAIGLEKSGTASQFRGQGAEGASDGLVMTYAVFDFTPTGDASGGEIGVNVQYLPPKSQAKGAVSRARWCDDKTMLECTLSHLADGSVLITYGERSTHGDRTGLAWVADLHRADHLRVVARASNGYDVTERDEKVTRSEPVLTTAQLVDAVEQPWWGPQLPTYFAEQGSKLPSYQEIGGAAVATASATPSK